MKKGIIWMVTSMTVIFGTAEMPLQITLASVITVTMVFVAYGEYQAEKKREKKILS